LSSKFALARLTSALLQLGYDAINVHHEAASDDSYRLHRYLASCEVQQAARLASASKGCSPDIKDNFAPSFTHPCATALHSQPGFSNGVVFSAVIVPVTNE
jgi:hypothetical protein